MIGITKSGFEFEADAQTLDDWDILEQLSEMSEGNMLAAPKFLNKFLGKEQGKALVAHCREDGVAKTEKVLSEIFEIIGQLTEGKN